MHPASSRKLRERHLLLRFLEVAGIQTTAVEDSESPDFLLQTDGRTVGVEVTELFRPGVDGSTAPRAQENLTDRIVTAAKRMFQTESDRHVHVNVCFFEGIDIRTLHRDATAKSLAKRVQELPLQPGLHAHWRNDYEDSDLDAIAFVSALSVPEPSMAHWSVARAGWRASMSKELLVAAVSAKNPKLPVYRTNLQEVWLLLALEGNRPSQFFEPESVPDLGTLGSAFDRTYYFNAVHNQVLAWSRSDA